jgi:mannose-1-phosphate guanylyltransferase/mannose-1-phosphate guanylyltransferase/mannose-6-phosphate isomerase
LARKKGRAFMPWQERLCVLNNLSSVDEVYTFDDEDGTACHLLQQVRAHYPDAKIIFANGGDRTQDNIPEMAVDGVEFVFGIGGEDKANSSSWILQEWKAPKTERQWGYYRVLHEAPGMKVKELTVEPGKSLSMQRHFKRSEYWVVEEGNCVVNQEGGTVSLSTHETIDIPLNSWHQLTNPFDVPCRIVEIQYGEDCIEEDIERK